MVKKTSLFLFGFLWWAQATQIPSNKEIEKAYLDSYTLESAQNYLGAVQALSPALTAWPNAYTPNFRTGWLYYLSGHFADALRYYQKALVAIPSSIEVLNCISLVHKARLDWVKVEENCKRTLRIDYFDLDANYWLSVSLRMQGKFSLSERQCRQILAIRPTRTLFLFELGESLMEQKKWWEAKEVFQSVEILEPMNTMAKQRLEKVSTYIK